MTSTHIHTHVNAIDSDTIASAQNSTIKLAKALLTNNRQRVKHGKTVLEGTHLLEAAMQAEYEIEQILVAESSLQNNEVLNLLTQLTNKASNINLLKIEDKLYQSIRTLGTGIDIMAIVPIKKTELPNIDADSLILNDVQDSGNVGTLLRTASAIGIKNIICTSGTAGIWSPKTMRAGMGAQFRLHVYENVDLKELLTKVQVPMLATSPHTNNIIYKQDLSKPMAWIMGHEGQGVCDELLAKATPIALPQPNGQESLNVAIAGALCMYEMLRQRSFN